MGNMSRPAHLPTGPLHLFTYLASRALLPARRILSLGVFLPISLLAVSLLAAFLLAGVLLTGHIAARGKGPDCPAQAAAQAAAAPGFVTTQDEDNPACAGKHRIRAARRT
jgi:hypothetical protein